MCCHHLVDFPDRLPPQDLTGAPPAIKQKDRREPILFNFRTVIRSVAMTIVALPVMIVTMRAAIRDAKHALHTANHATDTRADRTTDNASDRARRAVTLISTFARAADDTLRVSGERGRKHDQKRKGPEQASLLRDIRGKNRCFHHTVSCPCP
jgi:hypothetical protein